MAHYAFLDDDNVVTEVIVGRDEWEVVDDIDDWETYYSSARGLACKRTSYNGNIRKNFAGIGFTYDEERDAFIPPKPFKSWLLSDETCQWEAPVPYPSDGRVYFWEEKVVDWTPVNDESAATE